MELFHISQAIYEAIGILTRIPSKEVLEGERDRFLGPATWAPLVRQAAVRLYQRRRGWALLRGDLPEYPSAAEWEAHEGDAAFERAWREMTLAIAKPLQILGVDGVGLGLTEVADYVAGMALLLNRAVGRYVPGGPSQADLDPLGAALMEPFMTERQHPSEEDSSGTP